LELSSSVPIDHEDAIFTLLISLPPRFLLLPLLSGPKLHSNIYGISVTFSHELSSKHYDNHILI